MKKIAFILLFLFTIQAKSQDIAARKYIHQIGLHAGFSTGTGLSYRYWPKKIGVQATILPIKFSKDKSDLTGANEFIGGIFPFDEYQEFISMGLTGLIKFNETKNLQFFGYWGNHYLITLEKDYNYDLVYHENKEEKKYNTALGVGFTTKSPVGVNLMIGYGVYDVLDKFNLLPTAEFGFYFCFPTH